jgi:hypothetical protein
MMKKQVLIRGNTVEAARRFMKRWEGTDDYDALVDRLEGEQRDLINKHIDTKGWFPVERYVDVLEKAKDTLGKADPERFLKDVGRFVLDDGANSLYRAFFASRAPRSSFADQRCFGGCSSRAISSRFFARANASSALASSTALIAPILFA